MRWIRTLLAVLALLLTVAVGFAVWFVHELDTLVVAPEDVHYGATNDVFAVFLAPELAQLLQAESGRRTGLQDWYGVVRGHCERLGLEGTAAALPALGYLAVENLNFVEDDPAWRVDETVILKRDFFRRVSGKKLSLRLMQRRDGRCAFGFEFFEF